MELSYIRLDDRLDAVQYAELRAPVWAQRAFQRRFLLSWLYHELSLEGVVLTADDLERAMSGRAGRDYCDDELLKRIRRYHEAVRRLKLASVKRERVTRGTLLEYQAIICGHQPRSPIRADPGATEAYKHDVVEPEDIERELNATLADVNRRIYLDHPVELAIRTGYRLTRIWPFEEHSAAVSRLVSNQILFTHGYPPALIHAHDRQRYYHALHYDISRLHSLIHEALDTQIAFRERLFLHPGVPLEQRLAC